jgi:predicted DNA-binding protein
MPGESLKCRIVSFRIADEEFAKLEVLAKNSGFSSVSYFVREAARKGTSFESIKMPIDLQIERLGDHIQTLTTSIEKVIRQLGRGADTEQILD